MERESRNGTSPSALAGRFVPREETSTHSVSSRESPQVPAKAPTHLRLALAEPASRGDPQSPGHPSRSVLRGASALLSAQPVTWSASLIAAAFVPRLLSAADLGQYAVAATLGGMAGTVASLGVPTYLTRRVAQQGARSASTGSTALVLVGATSAAVATAMMIVGTIAPLGTSQILLRIALVGMVIATTQNVLFAILIGQEWHSRFAWLNAAGAFAGTVVGIGVLVLGGGVLGYAIASLVVSSASLFFTWRVMRVRVVTHDLRARDLRDLFAGGLPFFAWDVVLRVRGQIDLLLVGLLAQPEVAGWLATGYRIAYASIFIPVAITTPLLPALSRVRDDEIAYRATLRGAISMMLILTTGFSAMLFAVAPAVPAVLGWSRSFEHSVPIMMILAVEQPILGLDMVLGVSLLALARERRWLGVITLGAIFNAVANLAAIPWFDAVVGNGAIGAGIVELATEAFILVGALSLTPRGLVDPQLLGTAVRVAVAALALVAVAAPLRDVSLVTAVVLGGAAYAAVALMLGVIRWSDLQSASRFAAGSLRRRFAR